jgi:hypothetical protein
MSTKLEKIKAVFDKKYMKKWKIRDNHTYYHLGINGVPINNNIYRDGGFNSFDPKQEFSLVMKGVEDMYRKDITDYTGSTPEHIADIWIAIDWNGDEVMTFKQFSSVYIYGCIVICDRKYYNLRTKEQYPFTHPDTVAETSKYLFLHSYADKRVYKIDKVTGDYETFD